MNWFGDNMKNITIEFSISSTDSQVQFKSSAEISENRLKFMDKEENTHYILFKENNIIEYFKRGSIQMQYRFDTDRVTRGTYEVDGNKFILDIKTLSVIHSKESLAIDYELLLENEVVNAASIMIKYL